jgi:GR25 family glycosyltransferase involved in LPS biosynthesis
MVNKIVINLKGDEDRFTKYKNATRLNATRGSETPLSFRERFTFRYNTLSKHKLAKIGNFASHIRALQKIVSNDLKNTIILEDDSSDFKLPSSLKDYPNAVYLGGYIVAPKIKDIRKPINRKKFHNGINEIDYERFRILETRAYFVPNKQEAKRMLDVIMSSPTLKNTDIFYSNNELIKYFYYPAVSLQMPNLKSTIDTNITGKSDPKRFY